jgi:hypothetical protein
MTSGALLVEHRDEVVGVQDLEAIGELDVLRVDRAGALFVDANGVRLRGRGLEHDLFEVEDDVATSSTTSGTVVNSCSAPSMRTP